jgi:hypothetical protein
MAIRFPESRGAGSVGPHAVKSCGLALEEVSASYRKAVDMVRRTVPEATVIDAVDDPRFATVVDVPVTIYPRHASTVHQTSHGVVTTGLGPATGWPGNRGTPQ